MFRKRIPAIEPYMREEALVGRGAEEPDLPSEEAAVDDDAHVRAELLRVHLEDASARLKLNSWTLLKLAKIKYF